MLTKSVLVLKYYVCLLPLMSYKRYEIESPNHCVDSSGNRSRPLHPELYLAPRQYDGYLNRAIRLNSVRSVTVTLKTNNPIVAYLLLCGWVLNILQSIGQQPPSDHDEPIRESSPVYRSFSRRTTFGRGPRTHKEFSPVDHY